MLWFHPMPFVHPINNYMWTLTVVKTKKSNISIEKCYYLHINYASHCNVLNLWNIHYFVVLFPHRIQMRYIILTIINIQLLSEITAIIFNRFEFGSLRKMCKNKKCDPVQGFEFFFLSPHRVCPSVYTEVQNFKCQSHYMSALLFCFISFQCIWLQCYKFICIHHNWLQTLVKNDDKSENTKRKVKKNEIIWKNTNYKYVFHTHTHTYRRSNVSDILFLANSSKFVFILR